MITNDELSVLLMCLGSLIWFYVFQRAIKAEAENARLRKVVDAARVLSDIWSVGGKPNLSNLRYALAELDKEGGE